MNHLTALLQNCTLLNNEASSYMLMFIVQLSTCIRTQVHHITSLILRNGQGYRLAKVQTDFTKFPHQLFLRDIVIHSAVVFTHKQSEAFLQLFVKLLYNPATVKVWHLIVSVTKCCQHFLLHGV